jgi:hypothetical protein
MRAGLSQVSLFSDREWAKRLSAVHSLTSKEVAVCTRVARESEIVPYLAKAVSSYWQTSGYAYVSVALLSAFLTWFGCGLDETPGRRRQIQRFQVVAPQSLGQDFDLLIRRHCTIDNYQVALPEPTCASPGAIAYFAHDLLAAHLQSQALSGLRQLIDEPQQPRSLVIAHQISCATLVAPFGAPIVFRTACFDRRLFEFKQLAVERLYPAWEFLVLATHQSWTFHSRLGHVSALGEKATE